MTKSIDTLVDDIYGLFSNETKFSEDSVREFSEGLSRSIASRISEDRGEPSLRLSNLGTPCSRKLWYTINEPARAEPLPPAARIKFLFGDILEELLVFLSKEAGHRVEGRQDEISISGVLGHRDGVIDGRTVDIKSASTYSFKKFKANGLREDDPFGYLTQIGSYSYGSKNDPLVTDKDCHSFLVIDKTLGNITLDTYPTTETDYERMVEERRVMLANPEPPEREYSDEPEGKSGNRKLSMPCSYCPFKTRCWPSMRTFLYSTGPVYLTVVTREPKVLEVDKEGQVISRF